MPQLQHQLALLNRWVARTLTDDVRAVWEHPDAPVQLKKRILRTVLNEIIVQSERESRTHRLILHWAGGVHTELSVERNPSGQHRRQAERTVIDLVSELAKVCPDKAITAILNRLGYKTGQQKNWNASRVAGLRGYHHIEPFQKQDGWVTREQAAEELKVSNTVVRRLIREQILPQRRLSNARHGSSTEEILTCQLCKRKCKPYIMAVDCRRLCLAKRNCL
jgi:hypothetical protein